MEVLSGRSQRVKVSTYKERRRDIQSCLTCLSGRDAPSYHFDSKEFQRWEDRARSEDTPGDLRLNVSSRNNDAINNAYTD